MGLLNLLGLLCILVMMNLAGSVIHVRFLEAPQEYTRFSTAVFRYMVERPNGTNACENKLCSLSCELDGQTLRTCPADAIVLKNLTVNQRHSFLLTVTTGNGERNSSWYTWLVDTISPTANISTEESYTNAGKVTIDITFSEPCPGHGGFKCSNSSNCDVIVDGQAHVQSSSIRMINPDEKYKLDIVLYLNSIYGRVVIRMMDKFCTDKAGNFFARSNASVAVIHIDRRPVIVDLWMPVPSYVLEIDGVLRTVLATNKLEDLKIFLNFNIPIRNSTQRVLGALHVNSGNLVPLGGSNHNNRKFVFKLTNVSDTQIITVKLEAGVIIGRTGTPASPVSSLAILYDSKPPEVGLSTNVPSMTKASYFNVIVEFTKPVFGFDESMVDIEGGRLTRFKELSRALYSLRVLALSQNKVSVTIPAAKVKDISGNRNLASNRLEVHHYSTPAISLALHSFVTVGVLATSLAAAALSLSSASLIAAGTLPLGNSNNVASNPSMNLHGFIGHLQVFVLSNWLSSDLPVQYLETTEGLEWLIPRHKLPWKKDDPAKLLNHHLNEKRISNLQLAAFCWRRAYNKHDLNVTSISYEPHKLPFQNRLGPHSLASAQYGYPLSSDEYFTYFLRGEPVSASNVVKRMENYTGWQDLEMNLFWLGVAGGCLLIINVLTLIFLRWRTGTRVHGILSVPRFGLLLLILSLPNISQSAAFIIRGGTVGGIISGACLLIIPAAFILSVFLFLTFAICCGNLAQYKEIRHRSPEPRIKNLWFFIPGRPVTGKWFYREGLSSTFLSHVGILFEDRKGPQTLVYIDQNDPSVTSNWIESGQSGIGRMRAISSEDSTLEFKIPTGRRLLGCGRSLYIVLDLLRCVVIGVTAGAFSSKGSKQTQSIIALVITLTQFIYLSTLRPYIRRGVHMAEYVSLLCEIGIFGMSIATSSSNSIKAKTRGYLMLSLLFICFVAQITNGWYTLIKRVLTLSPQKNSVRLGLKVAAKGLLLPFLPRKHWSRVIPTFSIPKTGLSAIPPLSPERESTRTPRADPFSAMTATVVPMLSPATSPMLEDTQTASSAIVGVQRGAREGDKGKGLKATDKSEMKKLRQLAKASFSGHSTTAEEDRSSKTAFGELVFHQVSGSHLASTSEIRP